MIETFAGRTAVVTGAGSGIGRGLVLHAAGLGMNVIAADIEEPALNETVSIVEAAAASAAGVAGTAHASGAVIGVATDVADEGSVNRLADRAFTEFGSVHLLCNNAGVFSGGFMWERTLADWEWSMGVNLYGLVHAVRAFVPRMMASGDEGHIVNTASMGGLITNAYSGPYYTSKFAAVGFTECLAHDLRAVGSRIGVSVLVPSLINTRIGYSERNRSERFVDRQRAEMTPDAEFVTQALRDTTAGGMEPAEAAAIVFDAVAAGRFYIPTKPSFHEQIRGRHDDMQTLQLPRSPAID